MSKQNEVIKFLENIPEEIKIKVKKDMDAITAKLDLLEDSESSQVEKRVLKKIADFVDKEIFQEGIKHDNTMFSIKKEALEYFHQLYEYKIDFLKGLKNKIESNFS